MKATRGKSKRCAFGLSHEITLGKACAFEMRESPNVSVRALRFSNDVVCPGFVELEEIGIGMGNGLVGGPIDAHVFLALAAPHRYEFPPLNSGDSVRVRGRYTGMVPEGFKAGDTFLLSVAFKGPGASVD